MNDFEDFPPQLADAPPKPPRVPRRPAYDGVHPGHFAGPTALMGLAAVYCFATNHTGYWHPAKWYAFGVICLGSFAYMIWQARRDCVAAQPVEGFAVFNNSPGDAGGQVVVVPQ